MNKKAINILIGNIIFIILVVVFFAGMILFIVRIGSHATIIEQIYAKQIALIIDKAKPGTIISLDVSKLYEIAKKNKYDGNIIKIDNENNKVIVRLIFGKGYEYYFFNDADIVWNLKKEEKKLYMEIR